MLIDLFLQPLFPGWIYVTPLALLYIMLFRSRSYGFFILGVLWLDLWSGYPFGWASAIIMVVWLAIQFSRTYVRLPR